MAKPLVRASKVTLRSVSRLRAGVLFALRASILASTAASLTRCNIESECGAQPDSFVYFSGTVALPDDTIQSLTIEACLDSDCWATGAAQVGGPPGSDASSPAVTYFDNAGSWTVTQVHSGLYDFNGTIDPAIAPTGTATSGTARVRITSEGAVLYDQTVLDVRCIQGLEGCGDSPSETCSVSLP